MVSAAYLLVTLNALVGSRTDTAVQDLPAYEFTQTTNHFPNDTSYGPPPENETFIQRFAVNDAFYKPGGPIFMLSSGEIGYEYWTPVMTTGLVAELAQNFSGLAIALESRYYGESFPVPNVTTDNLRWLSIDQHIADIANFAQNVQIPGFEDEDLTAPSRPWILFGASLAGGQVAITLKAYPDIIYGAISSSGTVQSYAGYPQWFYKAQQHGPRDCMKSVEDIVAKIDHVIALNDSKAITELKTVFGLEELEDLGDFAVTIANPLLYPDNGWQELHWDPSVGSNEFYYFCGNLTNPDSPTNITRVDKQLAKYTNGKEWKNLGNYAEWIKTVIIPFCPEGTSISSNDCFGTLNATAYDDPFDLSEIRPYIYQICSEFGGYPPTMQLVFPPWPVQHYHFSQADPNWIDGTNSAGLALEADRLMQVDAASTLQRTLTQGNRLPLKPTYEIPGAGHVWDSRGLLDISLEPKFIQDVHYFELAAVKGWLDNFEEWRKSLPA
ncbi:extracelular serine carboxypeptidase [Flagelloscypha sp. PMI_526]|nr:extracelular serine carboxypeptidase [Flagelloscypha sp. PMI_526]